MRNGKPNLRKLRSEMLHRFDVMEANFTSQLVELQRKTGENYQEMEKYFTQQVLDTKVTFLRMRRTFGKDIRGLKERVKDVIDFVADMDQEIKDHKRDPRAHGS